MSASPSGPPDTEETQYCRHTNSPADRPDRRALRRGPVVQTDRQLEQLTFFIADLTYLLNLTCASARYLGLLSNSQLRFDGQKLAPDDLLNYLESMFKVGFGYDSHRFANHRALVLGGLRISDKGGLSGHSDADVVLHAVTDAILGAIAAGDIGEAFPDDDPQWKDADSGIFVRHAVSLAKDLGYSVSHCDVTVLAEMPKLQPYKKAMRESMASLLDAPPEAVSVKAKTNEGMGFIGRGEGVAAIAAVTLSSAR